MAKKKKKNKYYKVTNLQHMAKIQQLCLNQGNNKAQNVDT